MRMAGQSLTPDDGRKEIAINADSIAPNARAIAYAITVNFVDEYETINSAFGNMRPVKLMIYLTIVLSTVQKQMRSPSSENLGVQSFDEIEIGYISRRAIAESTGIPRENVRRIVQELIDDGRIIEASNGYVRQPPGFMEMPGIIEAVKELLQGTVKTMQALIDLRVIQIKCPGG
jgi:biotin operon repressor